MINILFGGWTLKKMNKKTSLYSDQSSSSRIERIKNETINSIKQTHIGGFHKK